MSRPAAEAKKPWRFGVAAILGAAVVLGPLVLDDDSMLKAALHAATSYSWLLLIPLLLWSLASREPRRMVVAGLLLAMPLARIAPGTLFRSAPEGPALLRVVTANLLMVHPDPEALLDELVALDPDVFVFEEFSPRWADAIARRPAMGAYPVRHVIVQEDSFGIAIYARVPMTIESVDLEGVDLLSAELEMGGRPLRLFGVHTLPPRTDAYAASWYAQMRSLRERVERSPTPVVLVGDLNATRFHPSFRRLLDAGLRDGHAEMGRAAATTWPNGVFWLPPLRFDHVLLGEGVAIRSIAEGRGEGSDHRPVIAELGWL